MSDERPANLALDEQKFATQKEVTRILLLIFYVDAEAFILPTITGGALFYAIQRLSGEHTTLIRAVNLNTYVMSLTEERRTQLDLREPEEIRRMRRDRAVE